MTDALCTRTDFFRSDFYDIMRENDTSRDVNYSCTQMFDRVSEEIHAIDTLIEMYAVDSDDDRKKEKRDELYRAAIKYKTYMIKHVFEFYKREMLDYSAGLVNSVTVDDVIMQFEKFDKEY